MATCNITPGEKAASYPLTVHCGLLPARPDDGTPALSTSATSMFNVTLEETAISYTGPTSVFNGQNLTVSGVLVEQPDGTPIAGRTVSFVLGSGSTQPQQTCTTNPTTDSTGTASCTIPNVNQTVGPVPLFVTFTSDGYYRTATVTPNISVGPQQVGTTLNVPTVTQDYNDAATVSATLIDTYTNAGAANEPVTITLTSPYGTQSCTGTTLASGVASCPMTPNEPAGTYTLSAAFTGDTTPWPHLEASTGSGLFVVTHEEAALKYTGATSVTSGSSAILSGVLTTDDPAPGTPIGANRTVTFTLGSGTSAQSCSGVTNPSGAASCPILKVNQTTSPAPVTANFAGDAWDIPASATRKRHDQHTDHLVGERDDRHLRPAHDDLGHVDQLGDRSPHQRADGDVDLERRRDLHRGDQRHGHCVVPHHADRGLGHLHRVGDLRWRHRARRP